MLADTYSGPPVQLEALPAIFGTGSLAIAYGVPIRTSTPGGQRLRLKTRYFNRYRNDFGWAVERVWGEVDVVIPIYVINLNADTERLAGMVRRLGALGLPFQRFPAYRGWNIPTRWLCEFENRSDGLDASHLKDGEVGCYASHLGVLEVFLQTGEPLALVLEDDVKLRMDFLTILDRLHYFPKDWDIIRLSNPAMNIHMVLSPIAFGMNIVKYYNIPAVSAGYFINRRGAKKIIGTKSLRFLPYDHAIGEGAYKYGLKTYGIDLPPVTQLLGYESSIDSQGSRNREKPRSNFGFIGNPKLLRHPINYFRKTCYRIQELSFIGWLYCERRKRAIRHIRKRGLIVSDAMKQVRL